MQTKDMDMITVCLILISLSGVSTLACLHCRDISQPRHCKTVDDCYIGEICGVERSKNGFGETVYNVGCFTESKCQNVTMYQDGDCRECCRSDLCNVHGCGQPVYPQNRGPICYNCQPQTNPDLCHSITFCEQDELCKYEVQREFGDFVYTSACSSLHECKLSSQQGPSIVGRDLTKAQLQHSGSTSRRSVTEHVCGGCCDQDLCNKGCNGTSLIITATDCYDIYNKNISQKSGVYNVTLWRSKQTIQVYCDMDTYPYGWTVFQKRFNGLVDFYRNFSEYTNGFGNLHGEFWMGLSFIEEMVSQYETDIRIDLTAADNDHMFESFENFSISTYPDFTLYLGRQTTFPFQDEKYGFSYYNGSKFTTYDRDVDTDIGNCAENAHGGWWYSSCVYENLNGEYVSPPGGQSSYTSGWGGFISYGWKMLNTLKSSQMKFRKHL